MRYCCKRQNYASFPNMTALALSTRFFQTLISTIYEHRFCHVLRGKQSSPLQPVGQSIRRSRTIPISKHSLTLKLDGASSSAAIWQWYVTQSLISSHLVHGTILILSRFDVLTIRCPSAFCIDPELSTIHIRRGKDCLV